MVEPTLLDKVLWNLGQGWLGCYRSLKTWWSLVRNSGPISQVHHYVLFSGLSYGRWFDFREPVRGLGYKPYHWLRQYLVLEGFLPETISVGGIAPFTIEAEHRNGLHLYFRSRSSTSLRIYGDTHNMFFSTVHYEDSEAEYLSLESEVFQHFYHLYSDYRHIFEP